MFRPLVFRDFVITDSKEHDHDILSACDQPCNNFWLPKFITSSEIPFQRMVITTEVWFYAQLVWGSSAGDKIMFGWFFDNLKAYLPCNNVVIKIITKFITPKTDPKCDFHGSDRLKIITRHNHAHYETVRASWVMFWEKLIFVLAGSGRRTRPRPL